jgi:site-specific DNA recombinase
MHFGEIRPFGVHRARGTGLLNNQLYIGKLIWNRLRYIKDPENGRRVSRLNHADDWIIADVRELRIVEQSLWERVKHRQGEIDNLPGVVALKATKFWEKRRDKHLLTGLLRCGHCGGGYAAVGRDYLACANARKLDICSQKRSCRRGALENHIVDLIRQRLMQPEAVAEFISAYSSEVNSGRAAANADRSRIEAERGHVMRRIDGLYDAIADGLRTSGLKDKLETLEARQAELDAILSNPAPSTVRLHPNLSEIYRRKVCALAETLKDPAIRATALEAMRSLISSITIREDEGAFTIAFEGAITALIGLAQPDAASNMDECSVKVVAGTGFEPVTFRL